MLKNVKNAKKSILDNIYIESMIAAINNKFNFKNK